MSKNLFKNKKGMSIVISTVIIIAISITMAIAVAFWAMGIGNSMTKFERLEFVSIYADTPVAARFQAGIQATAQVTQLVGDGVGTVTVTNSGSGYGSLNPPAILINGGGGIGATGSAIVQGGRIISITVTNPGSGYTSLPTITIQQPNPVTVTSFPVYIQLQNTGQAAATINNVFLNGKPYTAYPNLGQPGGQNIVGTILNVGVRNNNLYIYLPATTGSSTTNWRSGNYVEVEIETTAGRLYSSTVLLP
jgi:FlaG/FlaF family flagellin (archaellin)